MTVVPGIDEYARRVAEIPSCLDDLNSHRQKTWMWRCLPRWSRDDISEYLVMLARAESQCFSMWSSNARLPVPRRGIPMAQLGSDGLYHLVSEAGLWCGPLRRTVAITPDMEHVLAARERVPRWWGDGRSGAWRVTMTDVICGPETVPYGQRCPLPPRFGTWAAYSAGTSPEMRLRRSLIEAFGRACFICGVAPGVFVDHDHFSGMVRGLLCVDCNGRVDSCPHLRNCMFADYLNSPPAAELNLRYRGKLRDFEDRTTAAAIGVESILKTPDASQWQWQAPPSPCSLVDCQARRLSGADCCDLEDGLV